MEPTTLPLPSQWTKYFSGANGGELCMLWKYCTANRPVLDQTVCARLENASWRLWHRRQRALAAAGEGQAAAPPSKETLFRLPAGSARHLGMSSVIDLLRSHLPQPRTAPPAGSDMHSLRLTSPLPIWRDKIRKSALIKSVSEPYLLDIYGVWPGITVFAEVAEARHREQRSHGEAAAAGPAASADFSAGGSPAAPTPPPPPLQQKHRRRSSRDLLPSGEAAAGPGGRQPPPQPATAFSKLPGDHRRMSSPKISLLSKLIHSNHLPDITSGSSGGSGGGPSSVLASSASSTASSSSAAAAAAAAVAARNSRDRDSGFARDSPYLATLCKSGSLGSVAALVCEQLGPAAIDMDPDALTSMLLTSERTGEVPPELRASRDTSGSRSRIRSGEGANPHLAYQQHQIDNVTGLGERRVSPKSKATPILAKSKSPQAGGEVPPAPLKQRASENALATITGNVLNNDAFHLNQHLHHLPPQYHHPHGYSNLRKSQTMPRLPNGGGGGGGAGNATINGMLHEQVSVAEAVAMVVASNAHAQAHAMARRGTTHSSAGSIPLSASHAGAASSGSDAMHLQRLSHHQQGEMEEGQQSLGQYRERQQSAQDLEVQYKEFFETPAQIW